MIKKTSSLFMISCLCLFVPAPPRFAFGLVLVLCTNIIALAAIMLENPIRRIVPARYQSILFMSGVLAVTMLLYALIGFLSALTAFTIGFIIYLIPVSVFINMHTFTAETQSLKQSVLQGAKTCGVLSGFGLLFFALRELLAYGTLSLPASSGVRIFSVFEGVRLFSVFFWATIPGALILLAFLLAAAGALFRRYGIRETDGEVL